MAQPNQSVSDDIAFLRDMAEAGRDRPMVGGSILFAAGLIYGAASLTVWGLLAAGRLENWMYGGVFLAATVVYLVALAALLRAVPKTGSAYQIATGVAWSAVGWAIFGIGVSLGVVAWRLQIPNLMSAFPCILMALYGASWLVAGTLMRRGWMKVVAAGAFLVGLACAWFVDQPTGWLLFGVGLLALLAAPGAVLMRQARQAA
jgi:hypothetical protein